MSETYIISVPIPFRPLVIPLLFRTSALSSCSRERPPSGTLLRGFRRIKTLLWSLLRMLSDGVGNVRLLAFLEMTGLSVVVSVRSGAVRLGVFVRHGHSWL